MHHSLLARDSSMRSRALTRLASAAALLTLAACGDAGPESGPGTLTAVLVSPNGAEGAAVISFPSSGVEAIGGVSGEVYSRVEGSSVRVVVVNEPGGELSFTVALADTTRKPTALVEQVAGPDDQLRATVSGYEVEYRR
jgi:hypothetical protein